MAINKRKFSVMRKRLASQAGPKPTCYYCGIVLGQDASYFRSRGITVPRDAMTLDHLVPVSRGGKRYAMANVVLACHGCNQDKANLTDREFMGRRE